MKNMRIALLLMAVGLMSVSCEEEKLDTSMRIPGLGGEEYIPNEIDEWLYDNFTAPYNIEVIYRWDASQVQSSWLRPIVPVEEDSAEAVARAAGVAVGRLADRLALWSRTELGDVR